MEIFGATECGEIVQVLNFVPINLKEVRNALSEFVRVKGRKCTLGDLMSLKGTPTWLARFTFGLHNEPKGATELEQFLTTLWLQELVDEWIETGVGTEGQKGPSKRDIFQTEKCLQVVEQLAKETPLQLLVLQKAREVAIIFGTPPRPDSKFASYALPKNLSERAENEAKRLFLCLLLSDRGTSVCKCRYEPCGRYFTLKKPRRNPMYCCLPHQRRAAALRCSSITRALGAQTLVNAAADLLNKWNSGSNWQSDVGLKNRLAAKLNFVIAQKSLHGYRESVGPKWVTRHRAKIERLRLDLKR